MPSLICKLLDWIRTLFWGKEMELTLVGLQHSGKSSFVNVITCGQFEELTTPTVGFAMRRITKGNVKIKLWDIGGQSRYRSMWERYCQVDVIVFMIDAANQANLEEARAELAQLLQKPRLDAIPVLVLANKADLPGAMDGVALRELLKIDSVKDREINFQTISCKDKHGIDSALQWLIQHSKPCRR